VANTFGDITVWTFIATANVTAGGQFLADSGSITDPGYAFTSDPNTGFYQSADNNLDITVNGVNYQNFTGSKIINIVRQALITASTKNNCDLSFDNDQDSGMMQFTADQFLVALVAEGEIAVGCKGAPQDREVHIPSGDLIVADRIVAGGAVVGATFEADSLETVGDVTVGGQIFVPDGSAGAPSYTFSNYTTTGIFSILENAIRFSSKGVEKFVIGEGSHTSTVRMQFPDGSADAPSILNIGDTDTGIYFPAANEVGFATEGAQAGYFDAEQDLYVTNSIIAGGAVIGQTGEFEFVRVNDQIEIQIGSLSAPGLFFAGDPNTGIVQTAPDTFTFAAGGLATMFVTTSAVLLLPQLQAVTGDAANPQYSFALASVAGMYVEGFGGDLGFTTNGVSAMLIDSATQIVDIPAGLTVGDNIVATGAGEGATFEADSLEVIGDVTV